MQGLMWYSSSRRERSCVTVLSWSKQPMAVTTINITPADMSVLMQVYSPGRALTALMAGGVWWRRRGGGSGSRHIGDKVTPTFELSCVLFSQPACWDFASFSFYTICGGVLVLLLQQCLVLISFTLIFFLSFKFFFLLHNRCWCFFFFTGKIWEKSWNLKHSL